MEVGTGFVAIIGLLFTTTTCKAVINVDKYVSMSTFDGSCHEFTIHM